MTTFKNAYSIASDPGRDIALFVNDFYPEFVTALEKLSTKLGRPLRGITLVDKKVKRQRQATSGQDNSSEEIVLDFSNQAEVREAIRGIEDNVLLLVCGADANQPYLKRLLPHLPYVLGPTETSLDWATNKSKMRAMLASYDRSLVPNNITVAGATDKDIADILSCISFPMIIKPTGLASSTLVTRINNERELRNELARSFELIHDIYARDGGRGDPRMIVEEFMVGDMFTTDVYVDEVGHTWATPLLRSQTAYALGMEGLGFSIFRSDNYIELSQEDVQAGLCTAEKAVHAVCLRSSVAHVELYRTEDGWKIIELGPRAGGQRQDIYELGYGIDHAYNELLIKIGHEPEVKAELLKYVQTVNIYAEEEGTIMAIDGIEEMRQYPALSHLRIFAEPGTKAESSTNGGKVLADCLVTAKDYEQLERDADAVRSILRITIQKAGTQTVTKARTLGKR